MKKLIALTLSCGLSFASLASSNVIFNYETKSQPAHVKSYITKTLKTKCADAFDSGSVVVVKSVSSMILDQGMEREYTAVIEVSSDYGHSPAETITMEFDEDVYHGPGFYLFRLNASAPNLCQ